MRRRNARSGFTLVELLITLAAAALLMGGVLTVVAATARDQLRMGDEHARQSAAWRRLTELLRRDLLTARSIKPLGDGAGVELESFSAIDPQTRELLDRAVTVRYEVRGEPGTRKLFREQHYRDERVPSKPWTQLVADGTSLLGVRPVLLKGQNSEASDANAVQNQRTIGQCDVELVFEDPARPPLRCSVVLH